MLQKLMFERILVPFDGSDCSKQVIPIAIRLALASHGSIRVLNVVPTIQHEDSFVVAIPNAIKVTPDYTEVVPAYYDAASLGPVLVLKKYMEEAEADVKGFANAVAQAHVQVISEVRTGAPSKEILEVTRAAEFEINPEGQTTKVSDRIDLVVISSHGRTGFRRWVLGSVAEEVANHSPVPVLILPCTEPADAELPDYIRVLIPLDGSILAEAALEPTAKLVRALATSVAGDTKPRQGSLHLACVLTPEKESLSARAYLQDVKERLSREPVVADLSITSSLIESEDVPSALLAVADGSDYGEVLTGEPLSGPCSLIAMSTHGMGGWERWPMGSKTDEVLKRTSLPMLIVRPDQSRIKKEVETGAEMGWSRR